MFSLKQRMGDVTSNLKFQKLEIPSSLSAEGARLVSISPDNQWLCVVRPNSDIYLANIIPPSSPQERPQISPKLVKLKRAERYARHEKESHGTLGFYERTIRCIAFSDDSRMLASGDIGGYIDTWVLEEAGEGGQKALEPKGRSSSISSDDDDSSDDEDNTLVIQGQRWIPTPHETPIPRMKAGILFISFRPRNQNQSPATTNGNHAPLKSQTPSEDRLMVLTGEHQLAEFDTLKGKLSDWSRRNPKGCLPSEFSGIKDRAMGALWDVKGDRERLWLYGPNWMWMFDLSQDFPSPEEGDATALARIENKSTSSSIKRKREKENEDIQERKRLNTGAGDKIPLMKSQVGQGDSIRKVTGKDESNAELVSLRGKKGKSKKAADDDDEDEVDNYDETSTANELTLAKLRREQAAEHEDEDDADEEQPVLTNGHVSSSPFKSKKGANFAVVINNKGKRVEEPQEDDEDLQIQKELEDTPGLELQPQPHRRWWSTYKYRDVLGIVPLGSHGEDEGVVGPEVAVVERPMWDVDLPGRYLRDYE